MAKTTKNRSKPRLVSDRLRDALAAAPGTRYRISQETGVSESILSRFVRRERGLDLTSVDKLARYLGLDLIPKTTSNDSETRGD